MKVYTTDRGARLRAYKVSNGDTVVEVTVSAASPSGFSRFTLTPAECVIVAEALI